MVVSGRKKNKTAEIRSKVGIKSCSAEKVVNEKDQSWCSQGNYY